MDIIIFLLLTVICFGLIYIIHKYFNKEEFYLLAIIYSVVSFLMSFKIIKLIGVNINTSIIFSSGLLIILYYFINRYEKKEIRKLISIIMISVLVSDFFFLITSFMIPSVYNSFASEYQNIVFNNSIIMVLYPLSLFITLLISNYCFKELKLEKKNQLIKTLLTIVGLIFIDTFIFTYFSYAVLARFDIALKIALDNYLIKTFIMVIYILFINKIFGVKKVK